MTEAPKPILLVIAVVALIAIGGSLYVGYYAMTRPPAVDHPSLATAPATPAAPSATPAPSLPAEPPPT